MGAGKKNEDPVTWGDLLEICERLSKVEQDVNWLKASIQDIRDMLHELAEGVEGYKKWIVTGLIAGLMGSSVFLAILKMLIGV